IEELATKLDKRSSGLPRQGLELGIGSSAERPRSPIRAVLVHRATSGACLGTTVTRGHPGDSGSPRPTLLNGRDDRSATATHLGGRAPLRPVSTVARLLRRAGSR